MGTVPAGVAAAAAAAVAATAVGAAKTSRVPAGGHYWGGGGVGTWAWVGRGHCPRSRNPEEELTFGRLTKP